MADRGAAYVVSKRDRLAWWLADKALRIATPEYRQWIGASIRLGLRTAVEEAKQQTWNAPR